MHQTDPKNDIYMVMLENRDILITEVYEEEKERTNRSYVFITPALVITQRGERGTLGLMLTPWLPNEVLNNTIIEYRKDKIVGVLAPKPSMVSLYKAWASIERDKQVEFGKDFDSQIAELEQFQTDKYTRTKQIHQEETAEPMPNQYSPLTPVIFEMFDKDNDWGDSSVTH